MPIIGQFTINGHDYAPYVKQKTGLSWTRENTNDEDSGRDDGDVMRTNVTSHQRKLALKMGPMPFSLAMHNLEYNLTLTQFDHTGLITAFCTSSAIQWAAVRIRGKPSSRLRLLAGNTAKTYLF